MVLLRDLIFEPPDLRIGAADWYLNQLVSVDDTAKQSLELARNPRPVLRCLDVFSPGGRQTLCDRGGQALDQAKAHA